MAKQLNIFLDNRPGRLCHLTEVLAKNSINIRAMTIQDRQEFGLVKLIVDKPEDASLKLQEASFACAVKEVIAVYVDDKIGGLHELTEILFNAGINISDAYGIAAQSVFCIESKNPDEISVAFQGYRVVQGIELYAL